MSSCRGIRCASSSASAGSIASGQQRTVHAIRLFHPGTIEGKVLDHLRGRHQRADRDIAAAVFDGRRSITRSRTSGPSPLPQRRPRLAGLRQRRSPGACGAAQSRVDRAPRQAAGHRSSHFIASASSTRRANWSVKSARRHACARRHPEDHRRWRQLIAGIIRRRRASRLHPTVRHRSLERRIGTIRARLQLGRAIRFQRSLFDGRADAAAAARRAIADRSGRCAGARLRSVTAPMSVEASRSSLIAAWPERRR